MKFGRLFLLAGLAAAAYLSPRGMSVFPGGAGTGSSDLLHSLQQLQLQNAAERGGGDGEPGFGQLIDSYNPNAPSVDFNSLIESAEREPALMSAGGGSELSRGLQELNNAGAFKAPVIQKLVSDYQKKQDQVFSIRDKVWDAWLFAQRWYLYHRRQVDLALWTVPWMLFLLALVTFALSQAGFARWLGEIGYGLAKNWLRVLSLAVIVISISTHSNPWPIIPRTLLLAPILWLMGSSYILHLVDMNYPFWNSTLRGCLSPLASMALIVLIQRAQPYLGS